MIQIKPLKLVTIIADRDKGKKLITFLNSHDFWYNLGVLGKGTAHTDFEAYSGLGEPEKVLVLCICDNDKAEYLFKVLKEEMHIEIGGGLAFSIPVNSISCLHALKYLTEN